MKLTASALIAAGIIAISAALLAPTGLAQEATPPAQLCFAPGLPGGQALSTVNGISLEFPPGHRYNWGITPPVGGPATFSVCIVGTSARVFIYVSDCTEARRLNPTNDPELDSIFDAIVESCLVPPDGTSRFNPCLAGGPLPGGQPVQLPNGIRITPPGGTFYKIGTLPSSVPGYVVCYEGRDAYVVVSQVDCSEIRRHNPRMDPGADYFMDAVVASCVKVPVPTSTPRPGNTDSPNATVTPLPGEPSFITPPDTGNAGLK